MLLKYKKYRNNITMSLKASTVEDFEKKIEDSTFLCKGNKYTFLCDDFDFSYDKFVETATKLNKTIPKNRRIKRTSPGSMCISIEYNDGTETKGKITRCNIKPDVPEKEDYKTIHSYVITRMWFKHDE